MNLLGTLIGALIGSACGALFTLLYGLWDQNRKNKLETTMNLYRTFHSQEMMLVRVQADKVLKREKQKGQGWNYRELYGHLPAEEWLNISIMAHFFEQLAVYRKVGYLNDKLAKTLFSNYFNYFYNEYFKELNRSAIAANDVRGFVMVIEEIAPWLQQTKEQDKYLKKVEGTKRNQ
jgi:hypothetical protein